VLDVEATITLWHQRSTTGTRQYSTSTWK